jgi:hypothetical protein
MLRFVDSFDHYDIGDIALKWTLNTGNMGLTTGRHGQGLEFQTGIPSLGITLDFQPTWIAGWAGRWENAGTAPTGFGFWTLKNIDTSIVGLVFRADSILELVGSDALPLGDSSPFVIHPSIWYYFELKITLSNSGGFLAINFELRVDGAVRITGSRTTSTAVSTLYSGAKANRIQWASMGGGGFATTIIDDLYVCDGQTGSGRANDDYQGDIIVEPIFPDGDQTPLDWAMQPNTGTQFSKINDATPDRDTTYIYSPTTDQKSQFDWQNIPTFTGTVQGVQISTFARKDDEGSRPFNHYTKPVSVEDHNPKQYVNDDYL